MTGLLYHPFKPDSIIHFKEGIDAYVDEAPFFKLSEILLAEIKRAGKVKLTQKGNLPMSVCKLLCDQDLIYWRYIQYVKKITEDAIPYLFPLKQYLLDDGIVKKRNNTLSLTKRGEKLLDAKKSTRFIQVFRYLARRFHWGYFHRLDDGGRSGQLGWAYSLALVAKYGDSPLLSEFYCLKLMRAFEKELWDAHQRRANTRYYQDAYEHRFFECFAHWFGLVNIERIKRPGLSYYEELSITKSELFEVEEWDAG